MTPSILALFLYVQVENNAIGKVLVPQLEAFHHEEPDTCMVFHVYHVATHTTQTVKILVRADDEDVFINFFAPC